MDTWIEYIQTHANYAPIFLFIGSLLAGMCVPISIDLLMIIAGTLAATAVSGNTYHLFFSMLLGCMFSAWIAYWIGRTLGSQLMKTRYFAKMLSKKRMDKVEVFFKKRGLYALLIGRFIPFGVRNCLYMTSGISKMSFPKFAFCDAFACFLWTLLTFSLYYTLGKNIETIYSQVKFANLLIFIAFSVTVIGIIWYKKRKKAKEKNV